MPEIYAGAEALKRDERFDFYLSETRMDRMLSAEAEESRLKVRSFSRTFEYSHRAIGFDPDMLEKLNLLPDKHHLEPCQRRFPGESLGG